MRWWSYFTIPNPHLLLKSIALSLMLQYLSTPAPATFHLSNCLKIKGYPPSCESWWRLVPKSAAFPLPEINFGVIKQSPKSSQTCAGLWVHCHLRCAWAFVWLIWTKESASHDVRSVCPKKNRGPLEPIRQK